MGKLGIRIALACFAFVAPLAGAQTKTIVFLGDSLSAGYGVEPSQSFPALVAEKIRAAQLPYKVENAGLSGDTSAGGLRRIDWLLQKPIDVLVLELGGNDALRGLSIETMKANLQAIITKVRAKNSQAKIVIAGMQVPPNLGAEYTERFRRAYIDLAQENHATLITFLLENVGGIRNLNQPDMIHPNPEGHRIIAETVWRTLEPLLRAG